MSFDSILFGNGLTINLLNQLKPFIPQEYSYLLNFDGFMSAFINGTLPNTIERKIFFAFYRENSRENHEYYAQMKEIINKYYRVCDGNIEKHFGLAVFQKQTPYNFDAIMSLMPFFL